MTAQYFGRYQGVARLAAFCAMGVVSACSADESLNAANTTTKPGKANDKPAQPGDAGTETGNELPGEPLTIEVRGDTPTFVALSAPEVAEPAAGEDAPRRWDLKFTGLQIFTNGGSSGSGAGAAFGPDDPLNFLFTSAPDVPFLRSDQAGGAFLDWYLYDGRDHTLWSRHHLYGVRSGDKLWKVEVLSYYGEQLGAPVGALYQLRYAAVDADGAGQLQALSGVDATAGGTVADADSPSACLNLDTGKTLALSPSAASERDDWHLCLRRDAISVNNEPSGPGDVMAADLDVSSFLSESVASVEALSAESSLKRFNGVDEAALSNPNLDYLRDGVVSAFADRWVERVGDELVPSDASWFVRGADGAHYYIVIFEAVSRLADDAGYRVKLRVRAVE
jgi:hypothetical protein